MKGSPIKFTVHLESEGDSEMFEDLARYLTYHPRLTRFLVNPAGLTFVVGWLLFLGMVVGWFGLLIVDATIARNAVLVSMAELTGGREVAIPLGLGLGVPVLLVAGISFTQDLVSTSWIYPLFYLFRKHNAGRENFAGYFFAKMERKAEDHRDFIERWGALGLYVFMLVPFAINGPLIGAIIGKLAGIRTRYILPTVILATATATAIWTGLWYYATEEVHAFTARFGGEKWIALGMLLILVAVVTATFFGFLRDVKHFRLVRARREEISRRGQVSQTLYAEQEPRTPPAEETGGSPPSQF